MFRPANLLALCLLLASLARPAGAAEAPATPDEAMRALVASYPAFLASYEKGTLVWRDGTRMAVRDAAPGKTPAERLAAPDILDQFVYAYPLGDPAEPPAQDQDPGRIRYLPLFDRMYGRCERDGVRRNLVAVAWMPGHGGRPLMFSKVNGAAAALEAVVGELELMPPEVTRILVPSAGTYNCRAIAGTNQQSAHGYGIAIDINVAYSDYWRWGGLARYRNRIPAAVVAAFERHGFIWGGRWYHFDTMHFEYRPELLALARRATQP